jgi:hypothetical protein
MVLKQSMTAIAVVALGVTAGAVAASAQQGCGGYYNQVMGAYQTLGPASPQYNQMLNDYTARCLSGASVAPYPTYYQQQPAAYDPRPYPYSQPVVVVDPGYSGHTEHNYSYGPRW